MAPPQLPLELLLTIAHYTIDRDNDSHHKRRYLHNVHSLRQVNRVFYVYFNPLFWQKTLSNERVNKRVISPRIFQSLIETNDISPIQFFLDCGADINCSLHFRVADEVVARSALEMACVLDKVPIARLLLENGADIKSCPLHTARSAEMVHLLLDFDADPEFQNRLGERPLHRYADELNTQAMRAIMQRGAAVNKIFGFFWWTPLHRAAQRGGADAIKTLLEFGADPTLLEAEGNTPLHFAAESGDGAAVLLLVQTWPDAVRLKNKNFNTPLHMAAGPGLRQSLKRSKMPCGFPARTEGLRLLLELWPDAVRTKNRNLETPLHLAAGVGLRPWVCWTERPCSDPVRAEVVGLLLESWPQGIREANINRATPLHLAVAAAEIEVVKLLVERWPEGVWERNLKLQTPLHLAAARQLEDVVELLAKYWPEDTDAIMDRDWGEMKQWY
jgi:ankyrin repeat protein